MVGKNCLCHALERHSQAIKNFIEEESEGAKEEEDKSL